MIWIVGEDLEKDSADGHVLGQLLATSKLSRADCFISKSISSGCPPEADRIVIMGERAWREVTNGSLPGSVWDWRGSLFAVSDIRHSITNRLKDITDAVIVLPTLHPSTLRQGGWHLWPVVCRDLHRAVHVIPARPFQPPFIYPHLPQSLPKDVPVVLDLETTPDGAQITLVGIYCDGYCYQEAWNERMHRVLSPLLCTSAPIIGHNLVGFDLRVLDEHGIAHTGPYYDTISLANVVNPDYTAPPEGGGQTLGSLSGVASVSVPSYFYWKRMLDDAASRRIALKILGRPDGYELGPWDTLKTYNWLDLWMTWMAYQGLVSQLDGKRLLLWHSEQVANCGHRIAARRNGMRFDVETAEKVKRKTIRDLSKYARYVEQTAFDAWNEEKCQVIRALDSLPKCSVHKGFSRKCPECATTVPQRETKAKLKKRLEKYEGEFNPASPHDWRWLLYEVRGLGKWMGQKDRTKGGLISVDDDALLALQRRLAKVGKADPLIRARLSMARLQKRLGTYLEPFLSGELLDEGGKHHPEFPDHRTASGRWAGGGQQGEK